MRMLAPVKSALLTRLRCVSTTPFGEPVVPEVYWMLAGSSGSTGSGGRSRPFASISSHCLFDNVGRYIRLIGAVFPGFLCDLLPDEHQPEVDRLRLFRDEYELLRDLYIQSFETCHKALRWVVGSHNASASGDPNVFTAVPGMSPEVSARVPRELDAFSKLVSAKKREWLKALPVWDQHWDQIFDRHLRNDIGHASARHDLPAGVILREGRQPIPYTRFVQRVHRIVHALLACTNVLK